MLTQCPKCKQVSHVGAKYCYLDGTLMINPDVKCGTCNRTFGPYDIFCEDCGTKLDKKIVMIKRLVQ